MGFHFSRCNRPVFTASLHYITYRMSRFIPESGRREKRAPKKVG
jgi:hypothetical protein